MRTLYWFTRDLRLHDNAALLAASKSDLLLCVFVVDPRWFRSGPFQSRAMGDHRWRFLWQSLMALERSLRPIGQRLHIAFGEPEQVIPDLVHQYAVEQVVRSRQPGTEEAAQWRLIRDQLPDVHCQSFETLTLFTEGALPMPLAELPDTFSRFRRQVEKRNAERSPALRLRTVSALPPPPGFAHDNRGDCPPVPEPRPDRPINGGEADGLAQLRAFLFDTDRIANYKETRNALDDWGSSSKLSPWGACPPGKWSKPLRDMSALEPRTPPPTGCGSNCYGVNTSTGMRSGMAPTCSGGMVFSVCGVHQVSTPTGSGPGVRAQRSILWSMPR